MRLHCALEYVREDRRIDPPLSGAGEKKKKEGKEKDIFRGSRKWLGESIVFRRCATECINTTLKEVDISILLSEYIGWV